MLQSAEGLNVYMISVLERGRTDDYASRRSKQAEKIQHEKNYEE